MQMTVRVDKSEYAHLKEIAKRYDLLRRAFSANYFEEPPVTSRKTILKAMKDTKRYDDAFLKSLDAGLRESSFFT